MAQTFPARTGLATGVVTALFGLSPLFLSTIGTIFFPDAKDGLDAPRYLLFLAIFCGSINFVGAFGLRAVPKKDINATQIVENPQPRAGNAGPPADPEMAPLLPRPSPPPRDYEKLSKLVLDVDFLLLGFIMLCCMGMVRVNRDYLR
jgi:hypothetical protein